MKTKFWVIGMITIAAITVTSCDFLFGTNKNQSSKILGVWQVDSIYVKDTNSLAPLLFAWASQQDSLLYDFKADSSYTELADSTDEGKRKYYVKKNTFFIQEAVEKAFIEYAIINKQDSIIELRQQDSVAIFLKKVR